ncbi:MAG: hypothetical protein ACHQKZ_11040 [Solirubrobacterales bacterium]|jgi:hypothetical protein
MSTAEPVPVEQVLWDELLHLKRHDGRQPAPPIDQVYARIGALPDDQALSALCLSGGGIRSATFNLGVLQALAELKLWGRFDYLSSVSGGGYIAGWLKAWAHRTPLARVAEMLSRPAGVAGFRPLAPEAKPLDHLREYSNYLAPRVGLLSADTWTAAAMIVRNLLLNWLVLVPVLTAVVAVPQVALIVATHSIPDLGWGVGALGAAVLLEIAASVAIYHLRQRRVGQARILWLGVLPLWSSALVLALAALWLRGPFPRSALWSFCALWCVAVPLLGWLAARVASRGQGLVPPATADLAGIVLSGAVAAFLLAMITNAWLPTLLRHPRRFVLFAVPILLGLYLLARTLFVAFASLAELSPRWTPDLANADREWWARLSGWVLILLFTWIGTSALVLGGHALAEMGHRVASLVAAGGLAAVSGLLTALLGASSRTSPSPNASVAREAPSPLREWALRLLAPAAIAGIVLVLAELSGLAGRLVTRDNSLLQPGALIQHTSVGEVVELVALFLVVPAGCTILSWLLGFVVNVNRFSGQGFYRNRLVRAYLGASNPARDPDPFTGFDPRDDLRLHELRLDPDGAPARPLPVVNVTLNLVSSAKLAWQQRKAESFSMTPLYCGNFEEGYRPSREYGGASGISLGTAMTISGAAANPSQGYHSSPLVSFLMTLFNVRLGAWLGNPNRHGAGTWRLSGPSHAWKSLFADLFSHTDSGHAYVSLSDGGHFENLGVYEMVLRRCRLILASDAGQDPGHDFEDLGNLIRKVRIDFGIPIEFAQPIRILARGAEGPGLLCAMARIRYDLVDRETPPGRLLYLKPTLLSEPLPPYDVFAYARSSPTFPHETTLDQFFTEAQFESYRALGRHLASQLGDEQAPPPSLASFFDAIEQRLARPAAPAPPASA